MAPVYSEAYLATQITTADRMELLISLYEGCLSNLTRAIAAIESANPAVASEMIQKTSNILVAMCEALDYQQDNGLAGNLFGFYNYQIRMLLEANRTQSIEALQTVHAALSIMLSGWQQVAKSPEAEAIRRIEDERREETRKSLVTARSLAMSA